MINFFVLGVTSLSTIKESTEACKTELEYNQEKTMCNSKSIDECHSSSNLEEIEDNNSGLQNLQLHDDGFETNAPKLDFASVNKFDTSITKESISPENNVENHKVKLLCLEVDTWEGSSQNSTTSFQCTGLDLPEKVESNAVQVHFKVCIIITIIATIITIIILKNFVFSLYP